MTTRALALPSVNASAYPMADPLEPGRDLLFGDDLTGAATSSAMDVVFGDYGQVDQNVADPHLPDPKLQKIQTTGGIQVMRTDRTDGADDVIIGSGADDHVFGGSGADLIAGHEGDNVVLGDNGFVSLLVGLHVESTDPAFFGGDRIVTGDGEDIVFGGTGDDVIHAGEGRNLVAGDNAVLDVIDTMVKLESIFPEFGGEDEITTGDADDLVVGGSGNDIIDAGDGDNGVLGDNGRFIRWTDLTPEWSILPVVITRLETTYPAIGGVDRITTGTGVDLIAGGTAGDVVDSGAGDDWVFGDNGGFDLIEIGNVLRGLAVTSTDNTIGGDDVIHAEDGDDVVIAGTGNDDADGGAGIDYLFGDNAAVNQVVAHGYVPAPPVNGLESAALQAEGLQAEWFGRPLPPLPAPPASGELRYLQITLLDHDVAAEAAGPLAWGDDHIAGGPDDDMIWGQLGDDVVQGDGDIDHRVDGEKVGAARDAAGYLVVRPSYEAPTDGDDYIEGGGGHDVVFGGLGADDIVGGSSAQFSLVTRAQRPDGNDLLFGGAGTDIARNDDSRGHVRDSDVMVGDNGNILRVVVADSTVITRVPWDHRSQRQALDEGLLLRVVVQLDYTEGGPDAQPLLFPGITQADAAGAGTGVVDVWGADEIHGESGDDAIWAGGGNDVVFGDAGDDNVVAGWGHDWVSGGTGVDVLHGDEAWALPAPACGGTCEPPMFANDVVFGGWDDDVIDGGWGHDALSGAEALATSYAPDYAGDVVETGWNRPFNNGNLLGRDPVTGEFALFNEHDPEMVITLNPDGTQVEIGWKRVPIVPPVTAVGESGSSAGPVAGDSVRGSCGHDCHGSPCRPRVQYEWVWTGPSDLVWFLTNDPADGRPIRTGHGWDDGRRGGHGCHGCGKRPVLTDGDDVVLGQDGNDWLVGGTGQDAMRAAPARTSCTAMTTRGPTRAATCTPTGTGRMRTCSSAVTAATSTSPTPAATRSSRATGTGVSPSCRPARSRGGRWSGWCRRRCGVRSRAFRTCRAHRPWPCRSSTRCPGTAWSVTTVRMDSPPGRRCTSRSWSSRTSGFRTAKRSGGAPATSPSPARTAVTVRTACCGRPP